MSTDAPTIESIPAVEEEPFDRGPAVGRQMRNDVEYRQTPDGEWIKSHAYWEWNDIPFLNKVAGWQKYRIVGVKL